MPEKARSQYRENEDDDYRIQNTTALDRSVSKESDHVDETDSSESPSEAICSNTSNSFRMSEILVVSKHEESVSTSKSGRGDATDDDILPDGSEINETDRLRDDTQITESHVDWTKAKQALVDLINETLSSDPVLRARTFAVLDPIDNPEDLVAILAHPLSKCDRFAEPSTNSECNKRKPTSISRGTNATIRDSDESNPSSDESESDSESTKNARKDVQSIVREEKTSKMPETISSASSNALASGPTRGDAKDLQSVLMGMKELTIDLHMDKSNLVPMNDLDGKKNAAPKIATPVKEKNLSVRNEFDDASSEDDDDDDEEDDDDDDDDDSSSLTSIDVNALDESDDENYTTRGARSARDTYSAVTPVSRNKNALVNHEYRASNIKTVNQTTWNPPEQTVLYILPGLVTPPSADVDVNYQQGTFIPQTNNGSLITQVSYPYSPASLAGDHADLDACQSVSNNGSVQNDGPCLDLHPKLPDFYTSNCVPAYQEPETSQNTASFSQSESVSAEKNSFEHDDDVDEKKLQSIVMQALMKLKFKEQKMLLCGHCDDESTIRQLLIDLRKSRGHIIPGKTRVPKGQSGQSNRNPLTVKQIIDEKLQVSIDPKLMNKMKADKLWAKMAQVFELDDQELMPANSETILMRLLKDSDNLSNNIELFVVLIERMTRIPSSFNNRDEQNRSALYLAAINFPTMPEIVGHLAKIMLESYAQLEMYKQLNETILGVLTKGDTHIEVLEELLNMERSGKKIFDVNSYISFEGKTMLEIASEVNTNYAGSAVRTIELLKRNACPAIRDYNGIRRQGNNIQPDYVDPQPRAIAGYVRYTPDTVGIAMVSDQFQNRQIVM